MAANVPQPLHNFVQELSARLVYPNEELAYFALKSALKAFLAPHVRILSPLGHLTIASYDLVLAETTGGKNVLRQSVCKIVEQFNTAYRRALGHDLDLPYYSVVKPHLTKINVALPASLQGLHYHLLEDSSAQYYIQDELGGFLRRAASDPCRQEMLSFLTHLYTSGFEKAAPPKAITNKHTEPVENPKVSTWMMSQTGNFIDNLSLDLAEKGFYGRLDIAVIGAAPKGYDFRNLTLFCDIQDIQPIFNTIVGILKENSVLDITFSPDGQKAWKTLDQKYAEPLKQRDDKFAGRIMEQAIKDAALFAIIHNRAIISGADLEEAFKQRMARYLAFKNEYDKADSLSEMHATAKALVSIKRLLDKNKDPNFFILASSIRASCRPYKNLSIRDQESVIKQLLIDGLFDGRKVEHASSPSKLIISS